MEKIKGKVLQSWFDISVIYTGTAVNAFHIALANNMSVTEKIDLGTPIKIPGNLVVNKKEIQYYQAKKILPATGITAQNAELIETGIGIGKMKIGSTFIVG